MTDERSRHFEQDLTAVLRQTAGDGAPASLRYRLADVTATPPLARRSWFAPPLRWAAVAVTVVAVAVLAFLMIPHENVGPTPSSSAQPTASGAPVSGSPTPSSEASPKATPSVSPSPTAIPTPAPAAWRSLAWSTPAAAPGLIQDVIPFGDGYVGVGGAWALGGMDAAFFSSPDGVRWTLVARQPTADSNVIVAHVVTVGTRLLAVGNAVMGGPGETPDFAPFLWVSSDGRQWTQLRRLTWDAALTGRGVSRLVAGAAGVLAVSIGADPVVLASSDGSTWTRGTLPATERAIAADATASASGFVIVGRDGQPDHFSEAVMESQSPPGVGRPAAWISPDGIHWTEASVEGNMVAGAGLANVVAVHGTLLAVGINSTADYYDSVMTSWTSADGRAWSIAADATWPLGPYTPILAADGDHALLLGWGPGAALGAWSTVDGLHWTRLAFTQGANAPVIDCGQETCVRLGGAWIEPDRVIVMASGDSTAASGGTAQWFWVATPGT
jgi:hypothetical protein